MASVENRDDVHHLISEVEQAEDPRLAVKLIRDRIAALNTEGKHVPEEFILIQNRFVEECVYASQGR
jgi:hypothetical protein